MAKKGKRPADTNALAKRIVDVATGDVPERDLEAHAGQREGGKRGGASRAEKLTPAQREEIARAAAAARWKKS